MLQEEFYEALDHRISGIAPSPKNAKHGQSEKIASDVDKFLAAGGEIQKVDTGQSGQGFTGFRYGIQLEGSYRNGDDRKKT